MKRCTVKQGRMRVIWGSIGIVFCAFLLSRAAETPDPLAAERAKLIGTITPTQAGVYETQTDPAGNYVYEATSAKPLVEGLTSFKVEPETIVPGLTTAIADRPLRVLGDPSFNGMYWRIGAIQPGRYWVGVVYQSGAMWKNVEAPQMGLGVLDIYLNGRVVQSPTLSDPVQVAPGIWFAETQAGATETLKEGDEIAVTANYGYTVRAARLVLRTAEPARGAHRLRVNPGANWWNQDTALSLRADPTFVPAPGKNIANLDIWWRQEQVLESPDDFLRGADGRAVARCTLANPLPVAVEVDYACTVRGYYRQIAGQDSTRLILAPHAAVTREILFETTPDDPAYSITVSVKAVNPPALGWPPYDELSFFPGYRQLMPWNTPYETAEHRRVVFKHQGSGERLRISLNGEWEMALTRELNPPVPAPVPLAFEPCTVPFSMRVKGKDPLAHGAYVRRTFVLPAGAETQTCRLVVESSGGALGGGISSEGTLYVNGQKVGNVRGIAAPLVADVSDAVRPGTNEVIAVVRDLLAIMDPDYVDPTNPAPNLAFMDAPGDCNADLALGGVWLETMPRVSARDIKVETSVRKKRIGTKLTVVNGPAAELRAVVKAWVEDARQPVLTVGEETVTLKPGESQTLEFGRRWRRPRMWSWNKPNLYVLAVEITDSATGRRLDLARERFGFRETWIEGNRIMFNGHPVNLKASGRPFGVRCDVMVGRGAAMPDYTDEIGGMVTELVSGLVNSSSKHNVARDAFWEVTRRNARAAVRRMWNHPSVIAWDLSNEWFCFAPYSGSDMELAARRFEGLSQSVRELDPTRWTFFNGDGDVGGLHDNISTHYMLDGAHPGVISGFGFNGHSVYLPDGAFWRPLDRDFLRHEEVVIGFHQNEKFRYGSKVIMDTENLWKVGGYMPPGPSKVIGEEDVVSSCVDITSGPWVWMWKQNLDGHRDLGVSLHALHEPWPGVLSRAHVVQTFIMPDLVHHGFAGRKWTRRYALLNDVFQPATLTLKWSLAGPDGTVAAHGRDRHRMGPGELTRDSLSFRLPAVTQRTRFTLQLRLEADGDFVCGEDRDIDVWPSTVAQRGTTEHRPDEPFAVGKLARKVLLFDPDGETAAALKALGVPFDKLSQLAPQPSALDPSSTVVIGESALDPASAKQTSALEAFVDAGGRVVVLAQTVLPQGLPVRTSLETREWSSQPFVRLPIHPVLTGITSWDLHFWAPDRVSARGAYNKPDGSAAIPLVDSGTDTGLEWVQMLEMYRGKGLYLLCQLPLVASWADEPMAREILARVVRYAAGRDAFRAPSQSLRIMAAEDGPVERRMQAVGVACERVAPDAGLDANAPTLFEAGEVPPETQRAAWKASLADGATLVVAGAGPDDADWLSDMADRPVTITLPRYRMWTGRGYRVGFDPLTAGLSQIDLYWKRYETSHLGSGAAQIEDPDYTIEPLQNWSVQADGARELVFPGALVEVRIGKGRLILDQRRWMTSNVDLTRLAERQLAALAIGLNVQIAPTAPLRELPADVGYRMIDLSPFANRAFSDDAPDDGKGGWSDQGPDADLRTFPTGRQNFKGVPFLIGSGPKSIVVLKSLARPPFSDTPEAVTIPVGYPVEGLYILHGSAWTSGRVAVYQMRYADGSTLDMPLIAGENARDWAAPDTGPFARERGTKTVAAWTGSCPMFPKVTVYRKLWVNPKPEVPITAVHYTIADKGAVPILVGMTLAVRKDPQEAAAERAKAEALLAQARAALDAGKLQNGRDLLSQAVAVDMKLWAAYETLAELAERGGSEDEKLDVYRQWAEAGATTPVPYNRLGEILERRKDPTGALDAYRRSLEIEWNQPPILEAVSRLENAPGS